MLVTNPTHLVPRSVSRSIARFSSDCGDVARDLVSSAGSHLIIDIALTPCGYDSLERFTSQAVVAHFYTCNRNFGTQNNGQNPQTT